jgi:hypothetical protein
MEVLDKHGPVSVAIDASHPLFSSYSQNPYASKAKNCNKNRIGFSKFILYLLKLKRLILIFLDHSVLLVGYKNYKYNETSWKIRLIRINLISIKKR